MQKRKGFTLVELVIVIAVIAILAGVLIGTFASVINRANASAEVQKTKSEEIAQKAEDILKKIEDSNWYGWEDFETSIVAKITQELKKQSTGLTEQQVEKIINDALTTWQANYQAGNTDLTEDQVKAIVENAIGTLHYEGVTEAQVRAIVNASGSSLASQLITPVQIKQIVTAANANNLTAAQVASVVTSASNTTVDQILSALNSSVEGLATSVEVEKLRDDIKGLAVSETDDVVVAKALNIKLKKSGLTTTTAVHPTVVFETIQVTPTLKMEASDANDIMWDSANNSFVVVKLSDDKYVYSENAATETAVADKYKLWKVVDSIDSACPYSQYLLGTTASGTIPVVAGIDVGKNTGISAISYVRQTGNAQTVVIRTNSELATLNVNAPLDTVYHYGQAGLIDIISVDSNASYHEHGEVALAKIANGRIVVTEEAEIGGIHVVETNDAFNDIKVAVVGNAEVPTITRDAVSEDSKTEEGTYTKFVLEVQTIASEDTAEDSSEYIWILVVVDGESEATTTTEVATSKMTLSEETKIAEASQSKVAKSIAETTEEATTAEAAEKALVSTLIINMDQLKSYITGDVVNGVIGSDIEVTEIMELGGDKILNLNGYTLNVNLSSGRPFVFSNGQSMTVNANEGKMIVTNSNAYGIFRLQSSGSELILNGGYYEGYVNDAAAIIWVGNLGSNLTYGVNVELNSVTASCIGQFIRDGSQSGHPAYESYNLPTNKYTIKGGNYTFNNGGIDVNGSITGFNLMFTDTVFDGVTATSAIGAITELDGGSVLFKNNNFEVLNSNNIQSWNATTIGVAYEADVTIESGTYSGYYGVSIFSSGGNLVINGGTITGSSGTCLDLYANTSQYSFGNTSTCVINGGTLSGETTCHGTVEVTDNR